MESRLSSFGAALLLILNIWASLTSAQNSETSPYASMNTVGTIEFKGTKLRVFEIDSGFQVAEPRIDFSDSCSFLRYNWMYSRYQLSLPIRLDSDALTSPLSTEKKVGQFTLTKIDVQLNAGLASPKSELTVLITGKPGSSELVFLCDTFKKCSRVSDELLSHPWSLQQTMQFSVIGRIGSTPVKFDAVSSAAPLNLKDCHRGRWFTIQRRVDNNLSFTKGWDEYVKGFGNPNSNFWIGLESLFVITATKDVDITWKNIETAMCRLRMDAEDMDGNKYWSEYENFQVMGPDQNYRLRVSGEVHGSTIRHFLEAAFHNEAEFSTYDRDNDKDPKMSCSRAFGYVGFWYGNCHTINPNAPMSNKKRNPALVYQSIIGADRSKFIQTNKFEMKLLCE